MDILIGNKPLYKYLAACIDQFRFGDTGGKLVIRARGKNINKAVDVAEELRRNLLSGDGLVPDVEISSEDILIKGRRIRISGILIKLKRRC